jgi:hypothetical protein
MNKGFEIRAAIDGGYFVLEINGNAERYYSPVLFAGPLRECLAFIAKKIVPLVTEGNTSEAVRETELAD